MKLHVCELRKVGDVFAVPMFLLLISYLLHKSERTNIENVILFFAVVGFIADLTFSVEYLTKNRKC